MAAMNLGPFHIDWTTLTISSDLDMRGLSTIPQTIRTIISNPNANPLAAILLLTVAVLFIIVLITTIAALVYRIMNKPRIIESMTYQDDSGKVRIIEREYRKPHDAMRKYYSILSLLAMFVIMWLATGALTQFNRICISCHSTSPHVAERTAGVHGNVSCVRCHEGMGWLGTTTFGMPVRLAHIVVGTFTQTNVPGYTAYPRGACLSCHSSIVAEGAVTKNSQTGLAMKHYHPAEAGISCEKCHQLEEGAAISRYSLDMQICLSCHNGTDATATCKACHTKGTRIDVSSGPSTDNARAQVTQPANQFCYRCHDPQPCDSCHGGFRMPHPTEYARLHANDASRRGPEVCMRCHNTWERDLDRNRGNCAFCHSSGDSWFTELQSLGH